MLLVVEDKPEDLDLIAHELVRYGEDYHVVCESSTEAGMKRLREARRRGRALRARRPVGAQMTGAEFLARARDVYPTPSCSYRRATAR